MGKIILAAAVLAIVWLWWRGRATRPSLTIAEARATLDLPAAADADAVRAAHRRLIAKVHPDAGGNQALAARINRARDVLLADIARKGLP